MAKKAATDETESAPIIDLRLKIARATLESISPYNQSKYNTAEKQPGEGHDAYERRTWREKAHINHDGNVVIPAIVLKNAISDAAKYMNEKIPGKGQQTYKAKIDAGVIAAAPIILPLRRENLIPNEVMCDSKGQPGKGSGSRVARIFPQIPEWKGVAEFHVMDNAIDETFFERALRVAGFFIGIGQHRPISRGSLGRFKVAKIEWEYPMD